jgi:transposase-like protein
MSKRIFTPEQIADLLKNKNVSKCSKKSITYSKEFKLSAITLYNEGLGCSEIFREAGFDPELVGVDNPRACLLRWRQSISRHGGAGLINDGRGRTGRPKTRGLSDTDQIKRLKIEVAYLRAENDFLAKLRAKKRS